MTINYAQYQAEAYSALSALHTANDALNAAYVQLKAHGEVLHNAKEQDADLLAAIRTENADYHDAVAVPDPRTGKTNDAWRQDQERLWLKTHQPYQAVRQRLEKAIAEEAQARIAFGAAERHQQLARLTVEWHTAQAPAIAALLAGQAQGLPALTANTYKTYQRQALQQLISLDPAKALAVLTATPVAATTEEEK